MSRAWRGLALLAILAAALFIVVYPRITASTQPRTADLPPADAAAAQVAAIAAATAAANITPVAKVVVTPTPDPAQERKKRLDELEAKVLETPDDAAINAELGKIYFDDKAYARAADLFATSLEAAPGNASVRAQFAAALLYQGMLGMARREFQRAMTMDPSLPEPHYNLGIIMSHGVPQDIPGAVAHWNEVIRLAPNSEMAKSSEKFIASYATPEAGATPVTGAGPQSTGPAPAQ